VLTALGRVGVPEQVAGQQQRLQRPAQFMAGQVQGLALAGLATRAAFPFGLGLPRVPR